MKGILEYFTALTATAIIGVLATALIKDCRIRNILQIITGVLLLLVLIKPVARVNIEEIGLEMREFFSKEFSSKDYESLYREKLRQQVKTTAEDYIKKKAESVGAFIMVEIELSTDDYPIPVGLKIIGTLTGQQQSTLQEYITQELGIPVENQRWELYE